VRPPETDPIRDDPAGRSALDLVYREHHEFVWRSLLRLGVPPTQVEDAMHETFLVVARRLSEFAGRSSLRTWLFAIAMRVAMSLRRDAARERRHLDRFGQELHTHTSEPHHQRDASHVLHRLLATLDDDRRAMFIMAELEGMTAPEIAEVTGAKLPTIYSRLRSARAAMEQAARELSGPPRRSP
jgi:RNA polymerase sigma-70 factor (ECF subfamily)